MDVMVCDWSGKKEARQIRCIWWGHLPVGLAFHGTYPRYTSTPRTFFWTEWTWEDGGNMVGSSSHKLYFHTAS